MPFSALAPAAPLDPLGPRIYSLRKDGVHGFLIDPQNGALSEIPESPFGGVVAQGALALYASKLQRLGCTAGLLRVGALTVLASMCVFDAAGCGGGGASPAPQGCYHAACDWHATWDVDHHLTPFLTTSTGAPLPGNPPVQLTLTVQ